MKVELFQNKTALFLEETLRSSFQIPTENKVIICRGLVHALSEVGRGLYSVYSHRAGVVWQSDCGPDIESLMPFFAREGMPLHPMKTHELKNVVDVQTRLGKTGLFAIVGDDDPLTGELHSSALLENELTSHRTFLIRLSYNAFLFEPLPIYAQPFTIRILSIAHGLSVVVLGARVNVDRLLFGNLHYEESLLKQLPQMICKKAPDRKLVMEFESKASVFTKPLFVADASRVYDRAVLSFEDCDGSAILDHFERELGLPPSTNETERLTETGSLCRWGDVTGMDWLRSRGFTQEQIRGLVVLDLTLLNDKSVKALEKAYFEVKKKQGQ